MKWIIMGLILLSVIAGGYTLCKRFKAGKCTITDTRFSQAGVSVHLDTRIMVMEYRMCHLSMIANIRTEPPAWYRILTYDCVISFNQREMAEYRVRFISAKMAKQFRQRLIAAIARAGGPFFT